MSKMSAITAPFAFVRKIAREKSGVAAIEFAMVAPIVFALFLGTLELSQAITADRRVTQIASSVADLVARTRQISSNPDLDGIMEIINEVIKPFDENRIRVTVMNVASNPDNATDVKICWVYHHKNGAADSSAAENGNYTLPAGLIEAGDSVVVAHVRYQYAPLVAKQFYVQTNLALEEKFYLKPRLSTMVEMDGKVCNFS